MYPKERSTVEFTYRFAELVPTIRTSKMSAAKTVLMIVS